MIISLQIRQKISKETKVFHIVIRVPPRGSLTRSEKLFSRFSIIPYPLKIDLSVKYGRKKTFTSVEKTSQPKPLRKDPRGGTRMTMRKTFVSFDVFRRICKETLKFKCLTHISG